MKKVLFWSFILLFVFAQSYFIYALLQPETAKSFTQLWYSFGVERTAYSKFVFRTIQWWVVLPFLCLGLAFSALSRASKWLPLAAIAVSFSGTVALYWSVYAPALLVYV
jgi:lipoprotein signal peptidase